MAAVDKTQGGIGEPASSAVAVTPHDTDELTVVSRGLYVGGTGDVKVHMHGNPTTAVTFSAVPVGTILPIRVTRVLSTGTTATLILNLY
jgi:hypothetical protein